MVLETRQYTLTEFFEFIKKPHNAARHFEWINGEVVEVVASGYASRVAARFVRYIDTFADEHDLGAVTTADGGYMISGKPYIPDVAFMSNKRQPIPEYFEGYNILAPDLVVEVLSPGNTETEITTKVVNYLNAGVMVWLADPEKQTVIVYHSGQDPVMLTVDDMLEGGAALPGFGVMVQNLFPAR